MKCQIFIDILLLIGVVYLFSMCSNTNKTTNNIDADYNISHYVDTIYGHVILTTVCDGKRNNFISVATLKIEDTDKINNN